MDIVRLAHARRRQRQDAGEITPLTVAMRRFALLKKRRKGARLPKMPAARPPIPVERSYMRDLIPYLESINRAVHLYILPALPHLTKEQEMLKPAAARNDAASDDVKRIVADASASVANDFTKEDIARIAAKKGVEASEWNKKVLKRGLKKVTGVDVLFYEPWMSDAIKLFTTFNVDLISSVGDDAFSDIQKIIFKEWQAGTRWEDIADQIEKYVDVGDGKIRSRAELIARDQINKLNGQLNYLRQSEVGVRRYVWRTVGDERVRDSHARKDGNEYSWDNPPADTGHPGEDYQCRCWAEPVLDDLIPGLEDFE